MLLLWVWPKVSLWRMKRTNTACKEMTLLDFASWRQDRTLMEIGIWTWKFKHVCWLNSTTHLDHNIPHYPSLFWFYCVISERIAPVMRCFDIVLVCESDSLAPALPWPDDISQTLMPFVACQQSYLTLVHTPLSWKHTVKYCITCYVHSLSWKCPHVFDKSQNQVMLMWIRPHICSH